MLISSRRFLWGTNCLLLLAAVLIYRPVRSWIDQVIIARAIHPNLRVQEIRFHGNRLVKDVSLVQAMQFDWGSDYGNRRFGLKAQNAWFVIENQPLVDKQLSVPRALLQGSRLYLDTLPGVAQVARADSKQTDKLQSDSLWQKHLDRRFGDMQWKDLRHSLDHLLQIDQFTQDCGQRVDQWLARNQQLATRAGELAPQTQAKENPLRIEVELDAQIAELDRLIEEDQQLVTEFGQIEQLVEKKFDEISDVFERQCELTSSTAEPEQDATLAYQRIARDLVQSAGEQIQIKFKDYSEVAQLLCQSALQDTSEDYNRDYRSAAGEIVSLQNLQASGVFRSDLTKAPFQMRSHYRQLQHQATENSAIAEFRYQFEVSPYTLRVHAANSLSSQQLIELKIAIVRESADASSWISSTEQLASPQWALSCTGDKVNGKFVIDSPLVPLLAEGDTRLASALMAEVAKHKEAGTQIEPIELSVSGNWRSLKCQLNSPFVPQWLISAVSTRSQEIQQQQEKQKIAQLESYFESELERLYGALNGMIERSKKQKLSNSQFMLATRTRLQESLQEAENVEFARAKGNDVNR